MPCRPVSLWERRRQRWASPEEWRFFRALESGRPWPAGSGDVWRQRERDTVAVFRCLLRLPDGEPNDPLGFVSAIPTWSVGEVLNFGAGEQLHNLT